MQAVVHYYSSISDITATILGDKGIIYKIDCGSTLNSIAFALCQSDQLVRKRSSSWNSVLEALDQVPIFHLGPRYWVNDDIGPMRGYSGADVGLMRETLSMTSGVAMLRVRSHPLRRAVLSVCGDMGR